MCLFLIPTEAQMLRLGERIGESALSGDLLFLYGDLGTGKTTLTKGIARGMKIEGPVTSPTFQLKKTYNGNLVLNHLDLYRLKNLSELDIIEPDVLIEEGVTVVEWGQLLMEKLQMDYLEIDIEYDLESNFRKVGIKAHGPRYDRFIKELKDADLGN